jgi:hypothetical protein
VALDPDLVVEVLPPEVVFDSEFVPVADAEDSLSLFVEDAVAVAFGAVVAVADAESLVR